MHPGSRPSQRFPRRFRILKQLDFRSFRGSSQLVKLSEALVYRKANDLGHFRVGITIRAKCSATERFKVKRVIREAFRRLRLRLGSQDYNVVIPKEKSLSHPYPIRLRDCLRNELIHALSPTTPLAL